MRMRTILLEIFWQKTTQVRYIKKLHKSLNNWHSIIDSELEDSKAFGKIGFGGGFGIGVNAPYGGAFNNVPDRVGSAPVTDLSVVISLNQ